jgi:predicted 2-oxoglutarate/Fe(II)-dependent dioxygenase YbiX
MFTKHTDRVFTIKNFCSPTECDELILLAESTGFVPASVRTHDGPQMLPRIRNNQRVEIEHDAWRDSLLARLQMEFTSSVMNENTPVGLPKRLRFYKYAVGERFKMHKDGAWHEDGLTSRLTFMVYLNDNFEGGATDFRDFQITPETGMALLFLHDTWHEGAEVLSGFKYVLRSDVFLGPHTHPTTADTFVCS